MLCTPYCSMISSLLHLVGLRPRVYYTLTNFRGGGKAPLAPPQYANETSASTNVELETLHSAIEARLAYFFTQQHWLRITVELHITARARKRLLLGRGAATPLSTEFWARNHLALEHIDLVIGHGRSGVPLSSTRLHQ